MKIISIHFIIILLLIAENLTEDVKWIPRNPEQTNWAIRYCQESESYGDNSLKAEWAHFDFQQKRDTRCYLRCLFKWLGFYEDDELHFKFYPNRILEQAAATGANIQIQSPHDKPQEREIPSRSNYCDEFYEMAKPIIDKHKHQFSTLLYTEQNLYKQYLIENEASIKNINQKASDFCRFKFPVKNWYTFNYEKAKSNPCFLNCLLLHYHLKSDTKVLKDPLFNNFVNKIRRTEGKDEIQANIECFLLFDLETTSDCTEATSFVECLIEDNVITAAELSQYMKAFDDDSGITYSQYA